MLLAFSGENLKYLITFDREQKTVNIITVLSEGDIHVSAQC